MEDNFIFVSNHPYLPWKKTLVPVLPGNLEEVLVPERRDHFRNIIVTFTAKLFIKSEVVKLLTSLD